jgi:5'-nucleotidase
VELVLFHTADTHSQLFPSTAVIGAFDAERGLGTAGTLAEAGGFSRLATVLRRERTVAERVLHVDSGDLFQGSLAFQRHQGEPELLAFDALGVDAQALGNHELDLGGDVLIERYQKLARFPLLAANYVADGTGGIQQVIRPSAILDAAGLRVLVVGVANTRSVPALGARPNDLRAFAADAAESVGQVIDQWRSSVDLVVVATHLGLDGDEELVRATSGIDVVLGGHQHLLLDEPVWVHDCARGVASGAWGRSRPCRSRPVPIIHSGAYGRYLRRLILTLEDARGLSGSDPLDGYEISALDSALLPVHAGVVPDPMVSDLLAPYANGAEIPGGPALLGFAPAPVERFGAASGDSPLGNLVASAVARLATADLALIGASSLRHDLPPGLHDEASLWRVLPFGDPVVRFRTTGSTLLRVFERAQRSASTRECRSQVHVARAVVRFDCPCDGPDCARVWVRQTEYPCVTDAHCQAFDGTCAESGDGEGRCLLPVLESENYEIATSAYLSEGGSGLFDAGTVGPTLSVSDSLAAAVVEALREAPRCGDGDTSALESCALALGRAGAEPSKSRAQCAALACIDGGAGAVRDGRIRMVRP